MLLKISNDAERSVRIAIIPTFCHLPHVNDINITNCHLDILNLELCFKSHLVLVFNHVCSVRVFLKTITKTMETPTNNKHTVPPTYGFKVNLNHEYPEKRNQNFTPSFRIIWNMLPLILRYLWYYVKAKLKGRMVVMDFLKTLESKQIYGVPIGGLGCGTIGRGFRGEFCRFQMKPGIYETSTVDANQFIVTIKDENDQTIFQSLLSTFKKKSLKSWENLIDGSKCKYTGLFPRAWTEYDLSEYGIKLICRQISPVIPHNYESSCLPCAVFVWDIENSCAEKRTVTITFTFKNGTGNHQEDKSSTCSSKAFTYEDTEGVILHHTIEKMHCSYALAAKSNSNVKVTKCLFFDPNSKGSDLWNELKKNGEFDKPKTSLNNQMFGEMAVGIAAKFTINPSESKEVEMNLVWDMPTISFPEKQKTYNKFYTKKFGLENSILKIVAFAFKNYAQWEEQIYDWQKDILNNSKLPDWYKSAIFNETYYVSDGGSLWVTMDEDLTEKLPKHDPRRTYGRFGYLEGHEYIMYSTYDVHFYASHNLFQNWPYLQKCMNYDLRDFVFMEIPTKMKMLETGEYVERKVPNTVPHDAGFPDEDPFRLINSYPIHDVSTWRDLNSKFVLMCFRDAVAGNPEAPDKQYVEDMYQACKAVVHNNMANAMDDNGLLVNGGRADQTYDAWPMTGVSSYCSGLWLAAIYSMIAMSDCLGMTEDKELYQNLLDKARKAFESILWNGSYYNFDCSKDQAKSIMSDQLCGHWYLRCCGIKDYKVFPKSHVLIALKTLYKNNVQSFCNGEMGAVNGFLDGKVDEVSPQSQEVWTGVTYALASTMIFEGMVEEGFQTAGGMYNSMVKLGLAYDTPEALYAEKYIRSMAYMRPLSIWSIQLAIEDSDLF